ncbi:hypothetical protein B4094_1628 [Bacillus licheniformis]|nr:hypothetical protein B4094_1628 [Bacillus licheniformis]
MKNLTKQIEEIDSEVSNYVILFGKGKINEDMFDKLTQPLEQKKEYIETELEIINSQINANKDVEDKNQKLKEYVSSFSEMVDKDLSMDEKRKFIDFFIEKVTLFDDDHMEIVWKSDGLNSNDDKVSLYNEGDAMKLNNSHKRLNYVQTYGG